MDLAKSYHAFATEFFPDAICVADRFHVNNYILDALNGIRRRVGAALQPQARADLKRSKHLLNMRHDSVNQEQQKHLQRILSYSSDLESAYELKEMLIDWYDLSLNHDTAKAGYERWLTKRPCPKYP